MLIKETKYKVNFIDKNDTFVGFDMEGQCCENYGWYIANSVTDQVQEEIRCAEGFWFDITADPVEYSTDDCYTVAFKLVNSSGEILYLHLFNEHNGYYSHGWNTSFGCEGYL